MAATPSVSGLTVKRLVTHVVGSALTAWLAGIGLQNGYGVHVPFLGTWSAVLGGLIVVGHVVGTAADSFHLSKAQAAGLLRQAESAATLAAMSSLAKSHGAGMKG